MHKTTVSFPNSGIPAFHGVRTLPYEIMIIWLQKVLSPADKNPPLPSMKLVNTKLFVVGTVHELPPTTIKIKRKAGNRSEKSGEVTSCLTNDEEQNTTFTQTA